MPLSQREVSSKPSQVKGRLRRAFKAESLQRRAAANLAAKRNANALLPVQNLIRRGVVTYVSALLLIAALTVAFHLLTDSIVKRQNSTARVVNLSGRQRMLSQRISMLALERANHSALHPDADTVQALKTAITQMASSHETLLHGSPDGRITPPSAAVAEVYFGKTYHLDAQVRAFLSRAGALSARPLSAMTTSDPDLLALEQASLEPLLTGLQAAVNANEQSSEQAIDHLRTVLAWLAGTMLLILLAEALLLYRPLFRKLERAQTQLTEIGRTDPLTGCLNRRAFAEEAERALVLARKTHQPLSVLMIDIDRFKAVNDQYGHASGDAAINAVVGSLLRGTRRNNLLGRRGGEEFAMLLRGARLPQAMIAGENLRAAVAALPVVLPFDKGGPIAVTISVGVARLSEEDDTIFRLLSRADRALYQAKRAGRDCVLSDGVESVDPENEPATLEGEAARFAHIRR